MAIVPFNIWFSNIMWYYAKFVKLVFFICDVENNMAALRNLYLLWAYGDN
jgi:hypothetical protein